MVRDFFWDDDFRFKWDDMLIHHATLEESQATGTMILQWVRKVYTDVIMLFLFFSQTSFLD